MFAALRRLWAVLAVTVAMTSLANAQESRRSPGGKFALLVGVKNYEKDLRPLPFTENDMTALAEVLKKAGYQRVVLMTQARGADEPRYLPEAAKIRKELTAILEDRREDDTVLIALAGHGVQFANEDEPFFCPMDAKLKDKKTLLSLTEVYRQMAASNAAAKVMFADCCRNNPEADPSVRGANDSRLEKVTDPQRHRPPGGVIALFSCSAGEEAYESRKLQHGVFFHYLIDGLKGKAAFRDDTAVTLGALTDYVQRHVPDYVKDEFGADCRQRPQQVGLPTGTVTLVRLENAANDTEKNRGSVSDFVPDKPKKDAPDLGARGRLAEGRRLLDEREYQRAVEVLTDAIRLDAKLAEAYAYRAYASLEVPAQKDKALGDAERCIELAPHLALGYAARAWVKAYKGQNDSALEDSEEAIRLDRRLALAYDARGLAYLHKNDYLRAIDEYTEAIRCEPSAARCNRLGVAHIRRQNLDAAFSYYNDAIRMDPRFGLAYANRGHVALSRKQYDKAIEDFSEGIRLGHRTAITYHNRGVAYNNKNDYDRALADYDEAIRIDPRYAAAYASRGNTYTNKGAYDRAIDDLTQAIHLDSKSTFGYQRRGRVYLLKKEYELAIEDCTEAIRFNPKDAFSHLNRGKARNYKGQFDAAITDFNECIRLDLKSAEVYEARGFSYNGKGEYDRAIVDFSEAIRLNPRSVEGYANRGNTYTNLGNITHKSEYFDRAIDDLTEAIRLNPRYGYAYQKRGRAHNNRGDYQEALADYQEALRIEPNNALAYEGRGDTYWNLERYRDAIDSYSAAIRIQPHNKRYYLKRADTYEQLGDRFHAQEDREHAK